MRSSVQTQLVEIKATDPGKSFISIQINSNINHELISLDIKLITKYLYSTG